MSTTRHHTEVVSLSELSHSRALPQGLDKHDPDRSRLLREKFEAWEKNQSSRRPDPEIHKAWIRYVLTNTLDLGGFLLEGHALQKMLMGLMMVAPEKGEMLREKGETLRADYGVIEPVSGKTRLLVSVCPLTRKVSKSLAQTGWKAPPTTPMIKLLHRTGVRLGLVTNGDQWMLVSAPSGETTGYTLFSCYSGELFDEPTTLRTCRTLLSTTRCCDVPEDEMPDNLLAHSFAAQQDGVNGLGHQARQAVEAIIQTLDKADQDHGRELLDDIPEEVLYEAVLTVMMRLVFLLCAEERELLLLGDDELYDKSYAVSTLREQLQETADQYGEEAIELHHDAWIRLLATFRTVYSGVKHDRFKLPAYGGNLFDPDRFPFLEGRKSGTSWRDEPAHPLPVDNRTVLHLLQALQVVEVKMPGRESFETRRLSFRTLDIEQIGHIYEGLLSHTVVRATEPVLGLVDARNNELEIPLSEMERIREKGENTFHRYMERQTRWRVAQVKQMLATEVDRHLFSKFRTVCHCDDELWQRIEPFAGLVRIDTFGYPVVIPTGSIYVTAGTNQRSSRTRYTPRSLTEPIVQYALEPLVYEGPAEGKPREKWKLRSPAELLKLNICDMACGSGEFLVQTCRYLAERLVEAWEEVEKQHPKLSDITPEGKASEGNPEETLIPKDTDERILYARRLVASRCIYGVDKNHLAVEMTKLSLWLLTLQKGKPFILLDHAIRNGDSLVGISDAHQLASFSLDGSGPEIPLITDAIKEHSDTVRILRQQITEHPDISVADIEKKARMLKNAQQQTQRLTYAANYLLAASWKLRSESDREEQLKEALTHVECGFQDLSVEQLEADGKRELEEVNCPVPFHWPLEFPEVFTIAGGFDAFLCNPPFPGGNRISTEYGSDYERHFKIVFPKPKKAADLCCYFFRRAFALLSSPSGRLGMLAPNNIIKGNSPAVSLGSIISQGGQVIRARRSFQWPGAPYTYATCIHICREQTNQEVVLDEQPCEVISSSLDVSFSTPPRVLSSRILNSKGKRMNGDGFIIDEDEKDVLVANAPHNSDVLAPYLDAKVFNGAPSLQRKQWAIDFGAMELEEAMKYTEPFRITKERVKSERDKLSSQAHEPRFWLYWDKRESFFTEVSQRERVLVCPDRTKHLSFKFFPTEWMFSDSLNVFDIQHHFHFAVMQSSIYETWSRQKDLSPNAFETFPFPPEDAQLERIGSAYQEHREEVMLQNDSGLTKTYNRFHDPKDSAENIRTLRELHVEMDNAVAAAYGWVDIALGHDFHETTQNLRYTVNEEARRTVLGRLVKLNHERYEEEVR